MQKIAYSTFQVLMILLSALFGSAVAMDVGPVRQVYSTSHAMNEPSSNSHIQIKWLAPENGLVEGYYVTFNTKMTHVFDEFNTADDAVELIRNETQVSSQDFSGADDVNYYCHIAAFALDTNDKEFIGPTGSEGPFRVDTVPPLMPVVNAPKAVRDRMITIQPGAYRANEMYISNVGYELNGQWEDFAQKRQWELRDIQGNQMIFVVFKDLAGNTSRASTAIRYDTVGPIPELFTAETLPARSSPIRITIVFDEPVTNFSSSDIQTSNCEIQNFVPDQPDLSSRFFLECMPFTQGKFQVSIKENVLQDEAGNTNQPSDMFEWIYDTSKPHIQPISDQMIIENAGSKSVAFSITNSQAFNGTLHIDAWAEQSSLIDQQGLEMNDQGNPLDITLSAGASQMLNLKMTPRQDQSGETLIHVLVSDATGMTAHTAFQLNVWDAPNISPISDIQMEESTAYSIAIVLTDVYKQNLVLSMTTSNTSLMGPNHMTVIGPVFNSNTFPYNCQTSNHASISLDLYFEPPKNNFGIVHLTLTATNTKDLSQTRAFKLNILPRNDLPELAMDSTVRCFEDQTAKIPVSITDIDQDEIVVSALSSDTTIVPENYIRWINQGLELFNPANISLQHSMTQDLILKIQPTANAYGDLTITVRVEDKGGVTEKNVQLTILSDNDPPSSPESLSFTINENVPNGTNVGTIPVADVDSPILTFEMQAISPSAHFQLNSLTGDITVNGNIDYETNLFYNLIAVVSDGYSHSSTRVNIYVANLNDHHPQLDDQYHISIQENTPIGTTIKTISATDVDNDSLSYTFTFETSNAPFAISQHTGEIWISKTVDYESESQYISTITVSDGVHETSRPLTITVSDLNEAPSMSGLPQLTVDQGQKYSFTPIAEDPDIEDQLFFYISNKPEWADLNVETGELSGTPANQHVGVARNIIISVRDEKSLSVSLPPFDITVLNTNDPPELIAPIDDVSVEKHEQFLFTIPQDTFIDIDIGDVLTYQATELNKDQLPGWLTFDPVSRHFSGTPGTFDGGVFVIQVTVFDSFLTATSDAFLLTVIDHNIIPQITLPSPDIDFYENNDPVILDEYARVVDDDALNFEQGVLVAYFDKNGTINDHLQIKDHGFGNIPIGLDENKVYSEEQLIGIFSGGTYPEPLAVTFTHWADKTVVNALMRNIMFVNDSEYPVDSERRLAFTISDGDGGVSDPVFKTIYVHAINDDPELSINDQVINDTYTLPDIDEDETIVFENNLRIFIDDKDVGNGVMTASISAIKGIISVDPLNVETLKDVIGNHTSNITFSGTLDEINDGLNGMKYTSHQNAFGTESIRFYMKDNGHSGNGGGEFVFRSITFRINEINDPPRFSTIPPQVLMEDTPAQIPFSITETDLQKVGLQIKDLQQDMIIADSISLEGPLVENNFIINTSESNYANLTLNLMPVLNQTGNTYISLILNDGVYTATTRIDLYISPVNDAPIIWNQSKTIVEDSSMPISLSITDKDDDSLRLFLVTPPEHGVVDLDSENQRFIFTPQKDSTKAVFFTYRAHDNELQSNIGRVDIQIIPVNDPPKIDSIHDQTLVSQQTKTVVFSIIDVDNDLVNVSFESSNSQLFPKNQANLSIIPNNNNNYELHLNPVSGQFGTATITIVAQDPMNASTYESFDVEVKQADDTGPIISLFSPEVVRMDQNEAYIEPGYVAMDDIDGDVTGSVVTQSDLDTQKSGIYHMTYHGTDSMDNPSDPAERIIIVNKKLFDSQVISGNIIDDSGAQVGWVDIVVTGQGHTYQTSSIYDGYFELTTPITFDGSVWQMHLTRDEFYPQTLEFTSRRSFEKITLLGIDSQNAEVINGQCFGHQVNGTRVALPQVTIRARSLENDSILATSISDNDGHYTLAVDMRKRPYAFEAVKYGYETKTFDTHASSIVLIPVTTIFIEQPESMTDHSIARSLSQVTIYVRANPAFTKPDYHNEFSVQLLTGKEFRQIEPQWMESEQKYKIEHNKYEDFSLNLRADTTEDQDVENGYFVEHTFYFKSIQNTSKVYVTTGETQYLITQPFYVEQSELPSFMWIDRSGLSGLDIPKHLNYTIRDYIFTLETQKMNHVVEFVLNDSFGRKIETVDNSICLGIGIEPPVTRESLENQTYELIRAETVQDLLMGNGQAESFFSIYDKHVTFCTSGLSAFGFRKKESSSQQTASEDDSGGGCFLMIPFSGQ